MSSTSAVDRALDWVAKWLILTFLFKTRLPSVVEKCLRKLGLEHISSIYVLITLEQCMNTRYGGVCIQEKNHTILSKTPLGSLKQSAIYKVKQRDPSPATVVIFR